MSGAVCTHNTQLITIQDRLPAIASCLGFTRLHPAARRVGWAAGAIAGAEVGDVGCSRVLGCVRVGRGDALTAEGGRRRARIRQVWLFGLRHGRLPARRNLAKLS